jgi:methylenetetrahydrofolate dehydrogenase (NADP+)/methenyltetrahydrofolate cyclohydrolase
VAALIEGRQLAGEVHRTIEAAMACGGHCPGLAVVKVGDEPASAVYARGKRRTWGILSLGYDLSAATPKAELLALVARVEGILVQLPLPKRTGRTAVIERIDPANDVDGFSSLPHRPPCAAHPGDAPSIPWACPRETAQMTESRIDPGKGLLAPVVHRFLVPRCHPALRLPARRKRTGGLGLIEHDILPRVILEHQNLRDRQ